ncbi:hypothetical protein AX16_009130 [Volvariella volvacea WC 439]|nr:hypothetical protein AX16_009130 [Volvariella volvacea WC 439]
MAIDVPDYYQPNSRLKLRLGNYDDPEQILFVDVIRAFTPFTIAQCLLVKPSSSPPDSSFSHLPPNFVIKIYDSRWTSYRNGPYCKCPWSCDVEVNAASKRPFPNARNPDFEPWPEPHDDDVEGWEEWLFQSWEKSFDMEATTYKRLLHLQGEGISGCYDAVTFAQVDREVVDIGVVISLMRTVKAFGRAGVMHRDLRVENILLAPAERSTRAVILDFGTAKFRDNEPDEEWEEKVLYENDMGAIYGWLNHYIFQYFRLNVAGCGIALIYLGSDTY